MGSSLKDKVAVVTGSGGGIGRGIARALAAEGASVVVNDLGGTADGKSSGHAMADQVSAEINDLGGDAVANYDTVATQAGARSIIKTAIDKFGRIDFLINNAAITRPNMLWEMTEDDWDSLIAVNLKGPFLTTQAAAEHMIPQRSGRVINICSSVAFVGCTGLANYAASKGGLWAFTLTMACELGHYGITANAIFPSASGRMAGIRAPWLQKYTLVAGPNAAPPPPGQSVGRGAGESDDVAPLVVWLCRDAAKNVNGRGFVSRTGTIGLYGLNRVEKQVFTDHRYSQEELDSIMPQSLAQGLRNPSPPTEENTWPGAVSY